MTKDNNRKSRDDKSTPGNRNTGARKTSGSANDFKGKRSFGDKGSFGNKSSFEDRKGKFDDRSGKQRESARGFVRKEKDGDTGSFKDKPFRKSGDRKEGGAFGDNRPFRKRENDSYSKPGFKNKRGDFKPGDKYQGGPERAERAGRTDKKPVLRSRKNTAVKDDGLIRLNRYISNAGICSRRKADELISAGVVSVNGEVVSELGHKVDPSKDVIRYNGEVLKREKKIYVLLNKPKDYITTTDDPQERKTVMHLVEKASRERIYPVGRLDRNTTGLLLMTNDGELADRLSHPKNGITKIYHVELNKNLIQGDLNKLQFGLELEDGFIKPDSVSYVTGASKKEIGIQIHSGKNRIVRRIFEHLGYDVVKLDRVVYGNLTKKDLPRGRWRYLDEHELIQIKHLIK